MCGEMSCWAEGSPHALGECALLKAARSRITVKDAQSASNEIYYSIVVLRCLALRDRDMDKWKKLIMLKDCKSAAKKNGLKGVDVDAVVKIVKRWIPSSVVSEEIVAKLCRIFYINSLSLQPIPGHRTKGFCVS